MRTHMTRPIRFAVLAGLALGALTPAFGADDRAPAVALIKMPYRGERNLADLSDSPDYLEKGGLAKQLEDQGWRGRPVSPVALTPEEQKSYGEWNRLGLAQRQIGPTASPAIHKRRFPLGPLATSPGPQCRL